MLGWLLWRRHCFCGRCIRNVGRRTIRRLKPRSICSSTSSSLLVSMIIVTTVIIRCSIVRYIRRWRLTLIKRHWTGIHRGCVPDRWWRLLHILCNCFRCSSSSGNSCTLTSRPGPVLDLCLQMLAELSEFRIAQQRFGIDWIGCRRIGRLLVAGSRIHRTVAGAVLLWYQGFENGSHNGRIFDVTGAGQR